MAHFSRIVNYSLSPHALVRMNQRGVRMKTLLYVLEFADRRNKVGDNCVALSINKRTAASLIKKCLVPVQEQKSICKLVVVVDEKKYVVVSLLNYGNRKYKRPYLRGDHQQFPRWKRKRFH